MSLHPKIKDISCKKCNAVFVPFKKDIACPNCGRLIPNDFDMDFNFIPDTIDAMLYHKQRYGHYSPDGWYMGSITEQIMSVVFDAFDLLEQDKPKDQKEYLTNWLDETLTPNRKEEAYLINHTKDIIFEMLKIYQEQGFEEYLKDKYPDKAEIKKFNTFQRIKFWFKSLIP